MKQMRRTYFHLMVSMMLFAFLSCGSTKMERSRDLVVVEQTDSVVGDREENDYCRVEITVDAPVNGPQALVDSVLAEINGVLYDVCERCSHFDENVVAFSKEEMFTDDAEHLLSHYMEKYKPLLEDSVWNLFGLTMKMEAQTEKYVSYGIEFFHCGASCGSEKYYNIFDKSDGHQVKEIISHDNLKRFFEDYPEYATIEGYAWKYDPESEYDTFGYGLLEDHFTLVIHSGYNHYFTNEFPYSQIFSYLSPEAQALIERKVEEEPMLPAYLPERSEDDQVWMEVDTVNHALLGYVAAAGGPLVSTLMHYDPELEIYPRQIYSIDASEGSTVFLFIYSRGHLMYCDEALTCTIEEDGLRPAMLFSLDGQRDSVISCMWYDQLVAASDGFPFEEVDENRFGIHYDRFTKRLYYPIMEDHEKGSGYENCQRYTGRYQVLQFDGKTFVPAGTDGAWWLNKDLRNYQRTVSNKKTAEGYEQTDLMPDGKSRRTFWRGAKTLDDLRKKPDEISMK